MTLTRFLCKKIQLESHDFLEILIIWAIGFPVLELFGNLLFFFFRDEGESYFPVGPLMLLIFGAMFLILLVSARFTATYQLGLQMSITRKRMLLGEWLAALLNAAFTLLLIYLAFWIDQLVIALLWGGISPEDNLLFFIPWWVWPLIGGAALLVGFWGGALVCRYGVRGFWVLWAVFMLCMLAVQTLGDPVLDFIAAHGVPMSAGGILLAVGLTVFTIVQMLRIPVK